MNGIFLILPMNNWTFIIPSGGVGARMGADRPKQYLEINGMPLIVHTLKNIDSAFSKPLFVISMDSAWVQYLAPFLQEAGLSERCRFVPSGKERYDSVKNALSDIQTPWVGVHDAVRPFVSEGTSARITSALARHKAVIPVMPIKESIRKWTAAGSEALNRSSFVTVQTPQCFQEDVIKNAYALPYDDSITDDASLVERSGTPVCCVEGNVENIKITHRMDLLLAQHLLTPP
ncbi:MAG: 2-C-methyl-D-erythritol 4-phosphate cytidylyltransferase [Flavobacteriia bacterium]|nr:2-C-methyl-D-erythritol 4-phosphate cytidylyltransferase [Flavobacteriia bacterium]